MFFNVEQLIHDWGYWVIFGFIFAETALLIGFFLPGDTLLFAAGVYAATGRLDLVWVIIIASIAAIVGDSVGYSIGRRGGRKLFKHEESIFFSTSHLKRAEVFFEKHGPVTVLIARPVAFLRTFAPVVAGIGQMHYTKFLIYNIVGGILWVVVFTVLGWAATLFLAKVVEPETIMKIMDYVILGLVAFSVFGFSTVAIYQKLTRGKPRGVDALRKKLDE